ncbi:MAG TPA: DNA recombination protein RmuC [Thermoanaerobaculia bacterium]|nr:DNA recombination protein RmuC [Thermoanaerobaculia bacterium]
MTMTAVFLVVIALGLGAIVGWLAGSARKAAALQVELRGALAESHRALAERDLARNEREKTAIANRELQQRVEEAQRLAAVAETEGVEARRLLANHDALKKQIEDSFAALAQKAFKDVGETLAQTNSAQVTGALDTKKAEIEALLKPMRDMLDQYRGELHKSEHARNESYGGLQEQIRSLLTAQESAQREASRLANALQSPTVQGSWGEMSLKRCVEIAGMSEYCGDFETQATFMTDEGRRLRPDLIVNLPNRRVIAIDAKAPLTEYIAASAETDETRKRALLEQHAKNLRRHVDALAKRDYQSNVGETLDFTVMFIPGEHFLAAALATDLQLLDHAAEKKIFLASPTVLLPLLRAIAAGWKAERTEENAKKMHDAAVELFNRFVIAMEKIAMIGRALEGTVTKYNEAIRSIDARLWPKGEELQRMAGSGKELGELKQLEAVPLESSKLRLTMQNEEPGIVVAMRE